MDNHAYLIDPAKLVFIVGSPRSGTTWLSRMISAHPQAAAAEYELTLFSAYLAPLLSAWSKESSRFERSKQAFGLPAIITNDEFTHALRTAIDQVYARVLARKPSAVLVLDKHPGYVRHLGAIASLVPGCRCIHLVRDGRAAIASMLAAPDLMGHAGASVQAAAQEWAQSTAQAQKHGGIFGERFRTFRYEELVADPQAQLAEIFSFIGVEADAALCATIAASNHSSRGLVAQGTPPLSGARRDWQQRFTLKDRYWIHAIAGRQLQAWGYAHEGWWAFSPLDRLRMAFFPLRVRIGESMRMLKRIWTSPIARQVKP